MAEDGPGFDPSTEASATIADASGAFGGTAAPGMRLAQAEPGAQAPSAGSLWRDPQAQGVDPAGGTGTGAKAQSAEAPSSPGSLWTDPPNQAPPAATPPAPTPPDASAPAAQVAPPGAGPSAADAPADASAAAPEAPADAFLPPAEALDALAAQLEALTGALSAPDPHAWLRFVVPVVAILSLVSAVTGILAARFTAMQTARRRATLDLIEKTESTDHYRRLNAVFSDRRRTGGFGALSAPQGASDRADRRSVIDYLNHYELVALGIESKILDEAFYKSWMAGTFLRDWGAAQEFIQRERWVKDKAGVWRYDPTKFKAFEAAACRWSPDFQPLTAAAGGPPVDEAEGPGDEMLPRR